MTLVISWRHYLSIFLSFISLSFSKEEPFSSFPFPIFRFIFPPAAQRNPSSPFLFLIFFSFWSPIFPTTIHPLFPATTSDDHGESGTTVVTHGQSRSLVCVTFPVTRSADLAFCSSGRLIHYERQLNYSQFARGSTDLRRHSRWKQEWADSSIWRSTAQSGWTTPNTSTQSTNTRTTIRSASSKSATTRTKFGAFSPRTTTFTGNWDFWSILELNLDFWPISRNSYLWPFHW